MNNRFANIANAIAGSACLTGLMVLMFLIANSVYN